jgi:hypothetical protein
VTTFDRGKETVVQELRIGGNWLWHERKYPFNEVAGVGLQEYYDGGTKRNKPVITLNDGKRVSLTFDDDGHTRELVQAICAETGFARLDTP